MDLTLYLHMGQPKTGSSSIQRFCLQYQRILKENYDFFYPTPTGHPAHKHKNLFPFQQSDWEKVRDEALKSGCSRIVLSSEGLFSPGLRHKDHDEIKNCFPGCAIKGILYLRRIDDSCKSRYNQRLKNLREPEDYYPDCLRKLRDTRSPRLFPARRLEQVCAQLGRENMHLRIFDPPTLKNGNVVDDFFDIFGIELPRDMDRAHFYNPRLPDAALPYITAAARALSARDARYEEIEHRLRVIFRKAANEDALNSALLPALEKEIDAVDREWLPGYRQLYAGRPCDLSFPELRADPKDVLVVDLLYSILFELKRRGTLAGRLREALGALPPRMRTLISELKKRLSL